MASPGNGETFLRGSFGLFAGTQKRLPIRALHFPTINRRIATEESAKLRLIGDERIRFDAS